MDIASVTGSNRSCNHLRAREAPPLEQEQPVLLQVQWERLCPVVEAEEEPPARGQQQSGGQEPALLLGGSDAVAMIAGKTACGLTDSAGSSSAMRLLIRETSWAAWVCNLLACCRADRARARVCSACCRCSSARVLAREAAL